MIVPEQRIHIKHYSQGSALIAVIAAVLLFSILAAALVAMVGSSSQQVVFSNLTDRAYYAAETGYQYAMGRFRHPLAGDIDATGVLDSNLKALDNMDAEGDYSLGGNDGRFDLKIYSFFYVATTTAGAGTDRIEVLAPGAFAGDEIAGLGGQQVEIEGRRYTLGGASSIPENVDDPATFFISGPGLTESVPSGTLVLPATQGSGEQTLKDGELAYALNSAQMFPLRNGTIQVNGATLLTYRINDRINSKFVDVRSATSADISGMTVPDNARIVLMPYARIHATGSAGGGEFQARREVIYSGALPWSNESRRIPFEDKFETTADNWTHESPGTTTLIEDTGTGGKALGIEASSGESLISLKPSHTSASFEGFRSAGGTYLSYDAQVKIGFSDVTPTATDPMPVTVAAGLSFRLNSIGTSLETNTFNGYGLSFVKGDSSNAMKDIFPPGMTGEPLIVLWQQTGEKNTRRWLAYKRIQWAFFEDFDAAIIDETSAAENGWNNFGTARWKHWEYPPGSPPPCLYFDIDDGRYGEIETPTIDLSKWREGSTVTLTFDSRDDITIGEHSRQILVSYKEDTNTWSAFSPVSMEIPTPSALLWKKASAELSAYAGKFIKLRFYFNSIDVLNGTGWYIDNVAISAEPAWPIQDSTLLVRLKEAAVVQFTGASTSIAEGDWVRGSNTYGTVIAPVLLNAGSGILLLNNVTGQGFSAGEVLEVVGGTTTSSITVQAYDDSADRKVNIVKAYYASAAGSGTPDTDPLDRDTRPYPRRTADLSLEWPVDEGEPLTAEKDYFRLIQWDAINESLASVSFLAAGDRTMLRSNEAALQSQSITTIISPELGLHAYGAATEAAKVYFDDFGFQLLIPPQDLYPSPFQQ